ncbi:MAG: HK97 family phage prohead protease [Alphaproteobacteria bacterium]|nr:HK97 family phage prohead protease [Alphaproteobacteria bacterium]MDE2337351.1 HK97 family phage prohead protease [Alphaproteobacteria bacterium]
MTHDKFDAGFEVKFLAETGLFEGYASVFGVVDQVNDRIAPGAFRESLAAWAERKNFPPLLWQHEASAPIGAWREMREDGHGLFVKGDLFTRDIPRAQEAYKLLKENVVTGLSIGYRAQESHIERKSGVRVLTKVDLVEVSLVTFPANAAARVTGVKRGLSARAEDDIARLFAKNLRQAALEMKYDSVVRRLSADMRRAAAKVLLRKDDAGGADPDAVYPAAFSPLDLAGGLGDAPGSGLGDLASGIGDALGVLSSDEVGTLGDVIGARAEGSSLSDALDSSIDDPYSDSADRISNAAQSVEDYLGGSPEQWGSNGNGDIWAEGNGNKFRMDLNNPGWLPDGSPEDPHFHLQTLDDNGKWVDGGEQHRYYFDDGK